MTSKHNTDFDAIVVGMGFGGIYMMHKLRNEMGLTVRGFDKAGGVGGTWYWNRYPGALSDTESFVYRYSFDEELLQEWNWKTKYLKQPEILAYLEHVVERYDLSRDIQLNTAVEAAHYDELTGTWHITTDVGERFTCRYLVTALGLLSKTNFPDIKGRDTFEGELVHTGAWPEGLELAGKRVGIIGTGSTGQQVITAVAPEVEHLVVFQRTPQYAVPVGDGPVSEEEVARVKANYDKIWHDVKNSMVAFGFEESTTPAMSVSEEERQRVFQWAWDTGGGFRFMFGTFSDIATDPEANEAAATFIRSKIAEIVEDPETARKLTPTEPYARRPLCSKGYYETFNRDNVSLVDIKENPIAEITPKGVRTEDGVEHELDVLIFATGFEAVDGNYLKMDLRGRGGTRIQDHWSNGPTSYLGVTTAKFPNMFMILGPHGPFTNLPPSIETQVEFIAELISDAGNRDSVAVEATEDAENRWAQHCKEIADATVFSKAASWIFGANTPGRSKTVLFYMAGLRAYREELAKEKNSGYSGFTFSSPSLVSA
ncbi:flavin-containing monooxygenase [Saccharopolyspora rectivirgula]|uniref:Cyclohexanone monooxygenase n=1 Tax=Saccharopolyspora rectivirgula TaxID=28042 RepID=A0A073AZI4_9PSEU|nr:NAD(P)/FAD-dependent oxidoreductase [Saccharopolyspora rectivirgula]KEI44726.1 cyclohexanone monooxygenase [Saccharopolyspora rectivirgula]